MKKNNKILMALKSIIPDALAIVGALFIWAGVDKMFRPAGYIVGGIMLIGGAVIWSKGGSDK